MKKFCLVVLSLFLIWGTLFCPTYAQNDPESEKEDHSKWEFTDKATDLLKKTYREANDGEGSKVQATPLDSVSSKYCSDLSTPSNFTISRTLCNIKSWIKWYLQYIMYIWLVWATIFIIRNGFQVVTASDKEAQMKTFKKNMINLIIWVLLLTCFYFILEAFVSVVNFIAGD
jgi:hypothetical protein